VNVRDDFVHYLDSTNIPTSLAHEFQLRTIRLSREIPHSTPFTIPLAITINPSLQRSPTERPSVACMWRTPRLNQGWLCA
jgi:hypothetical protein